MPRPLGPGEGSKGQLSLNSNYKVNFKDCIPKFVNVLINKRYKTHRTGVLFCTLSHALGMELWVLGVKKLNSLEHVHIDTHIDMDDK